MPDQPKDPDPRDSRGPTEEEIDALLRQYAKGADPVRAGESSAPGAASPRGGESATRGGAAAAGGPAAEIGPAAFPLLGAEGVEKVEHPIEMLLDVPVKIRVELGRCRMQVQDILRLGRGAVVELDKLAGDSLDLYVNDRLVARGEVLVQNQSFCVRITEILGPKERKKGSKA